MGNFFLKLRGYEKIDEVRALWKHSFTDYNGRDVVIADYAVYSIWYNSRRDAYFMKLSGFNPLGHPMHAELRGIIDFCNMKPITDKFQFSWSSQDYFTHKDALMNYINSTFSEVQQDDGRILIIKFDMDQPRETILKMRIGDKALEDAIIGFKTHKLPKNVEIYEVLDNIIFTSEGDFAAVYSDMVSPRGMYDDGTEEE